MYNVCAVCNACGDLHTTGITISLNEGPASKQSIEDAFASKDPPPNIAELKENGCTAQRLEGSMLKGTPGKYS
jgi:hypothetical protein